jgi:DNA primase large subunit
LKAGWAYVPGREQSSIVFQEFEVNLVKALEVRKPCPSLTNQVNIASKLTAKSLPRLDEDSRLVPILSNLSQGFLAGVPSEWSGASEAASGKEIKAEMVDELARKHFPMCMRNLHGVLRTERHLKHFGRLQYGLFLKVRSISHIAIYTLDLYFLQVLGLPIEEAIAFWRKSFSKHSDETFNKEYKYNIRHSYGLEGKRANYPARRCVQQIH